MPTAAGRPRDPTVDERISRAALLLLRENGPHAVHIDAVAARSGVARTTIYRRFRDRGALLTATLELFVDAPFPGADVPVEDKLRWVPTRSESSSRTSWGEGRLLRCSRTRIPRSARPCVPAWGAG